VAGRGAGELGWRCLNRHRSLRAGRLRSHVPAVVRVAVAHDQTSAMMGGSRSRCSVTESAAAS
jgi:hypothetical protein